MKGYGREHSASEVLREGMSKMEGAGEKKGEGSGGFIGKEREHFSLENPDSVSREGS